LAATLRLACKVAQAVGIVGSAGKLVSPAPQVLLVLVAPAAAATPPVANAPPVGKAPPAAVDPPVTLVPVVELPPVALPPVEPLVPPKVPAPPVAWAPAEDSAPPVAVDPPFPALPPTPFEVVGLPLQPTNGTDRLRYVMNLCALRLSRIEWFISAPAIGQPELAIIGLNQPLSKVACAPAASRES